MNGSRAYDHELSETREENVELNPRVLPIFREEIACRGRRRINSVFLDTPHDEAFENYYLTWALGYRLRPFFLAGHGDR